MRVMLFKREIFVFYTLSALLVAMAIGVAGCSEFSFHKISQPNVNSFDNDDQGWRVSQGGKGNYSAIEGHPDGYFLATDTGEGVWYFMAPQAFINEVKKRYGQTLRFDLEQSATDSQIDTDDVILTDGTTTLTFNTAYNPRTIWTSYSIRLDEFSGWKKGKVLATKEDFQALLQNLTDLRIRGEFRSGADQGGIDNVAIY